MPGQAPKTAATVASEKTEGGLAARWYVSLGLGFRALGFSFRVDNRVEGLGLRVDN